MTRIRFRGLSAVAASLCSVTALAGLASAQVPQFNQPPLYQQQQPQPRPQPQKQQPAPQKKEQTVKQAPVEKPVEKQQQGEKKPEPLPEKKPESEPVAKQAQQTSKEQTPKFEKQNPVGGGWTTEVSPESKAEVAGGKELSPRGIELVKRINAYFNNITNLEGRFLQVDPDNKQSKGKFYVQRPGLLRFDYAPPSKMRIVADGRYLSIEDHDLQVIDKYPLESTPFRMLLRPDVDLFRDARIVSFAEADGVAVLGIEDKSGDSAGRLLLGFAVKDNSPEIILKEWIITDPQGLNTRIQLADLVTGKEQARDFFASATVGFPKRD